MDNTPLAGRIRPADFSDLVGQEHLFGEKGAIKRLIGSGRLTNMIFYGPPGTGKTTSANIIASKSDMRLYRLNATTAQISDIKDIIADTSNIFGSGGILLYLDEIQYFNKKQQQTLLEFLEDGRITLIASTTENPYLYIYPAIISRSAVFEFFALKNEDVVKALKRAITYLDGLSADDSVLSYIADCSAGDVRRSINLLETASRIADNGIITKEDVKSISPSFIGNFDKSATVHYDLLSALQKSIRGSDPDAAIFYLAKILEGGDLAGACRRLQVIASEDIGLAYSNAAVVVRSCVESAKDLGMPEAAIPLGHAAILLATSPKSNSANSALKAAQEAVRQGKGQTIPPYMRPSNSYDGYKYPHDYPNHYITQQYLPEDIKDAVFYTYGENKTEAAAEAYWEKIKGKKQ